MMKNQRAEGVPLTLALSPWGEGGKGGNVSHQGRGSNGGILSHQGRGKQRSAPPPGENEAEERRLKPSATDLFFRSFHT